MVNKVLNVRVDDYSIGSKGTASVTNRINFITSDLSAFNRINIYSIVSSKDKEVLRFSKQEKNNIVSYEVFLSNKNNMLYFLLKSLTALFFTLLFTYKSFLKQNRFYFYNILPLNCLFFSLLLIPRKGLRRRTYYGIEELYSSHDFNWIKNKTIAMVEYISVRFGINFIVINDLVESYIYKRNPDANVIVSFGYKTRADISTDFIEDNISNETLFYSGRLDDVGGIELLLNLSKSIEFNDYKIKISGYGSLESLVRESAKSSSLQFLGFMNDCDYNNMLNSSPICLSLLRNESRFSKYSFPSKLLQYIEYGNIVVSSKVYNKSFKEAFDDIVVFYERDDIASLKVAIDKAASTKVNKKDVINRFNAFMNNQLLLINDFIV